MPDFIKSPEDWYKLAQAVSQVGTTVAILLGGFWALYTYWKSTRVKAADTLIKLEEEFRRHIPTTIRLESNHLYDTEFKPLINRALGKSGGMAADDVEPLTALDSYLRHLITCRHVQCLKVGVKPIDEAYRYFVIQLKREDREELRQYVQACWAVLWKWVEATPGEPVIFEVQPQSINCQLPSSHSPLLLSTCEPLMARES